MLTVSDILKILDQVPVWRTLRGLPDRVAVLETRIAELEAKLEKPPAKAGQPCPACGELAMRRTATRPHTGPLGELGARDETWACTNCGDTEERVVSR